MRASTSSKPTNDKYKSARGGHSRLLAISCEHCGALLCHYQKDGPGILKRMYLDRMTGSVPQGQNLTCGSCGRVLGVKTVYEKEQWPAYRLFVGAVVKKVVKSSDIPDPAIQS